MSKHLQSRPIQAVPKVPKVQIDQSFDWQDLNNKPIIGIDEVGRGCLAGPVYAAAVIVPDAAIEILMKAGVTDSKKVSESKRAPLSQLILENCSVGLGFATNEEIDRINILQATFLAMRRALMNLSSQLPLGLQSNPSLNRGTSYGHLLIDGNQKLPFSGTEFESCASTHEVQTFRSFASLPQTTVIKGDLRALPIAAASIVAKVARDRLMVDLDGEFPAYGFKGHKGYAAEVHREAIKKFGPSSVHRKTFGGVREYLRE